MMYAATTSGETMNEGWGGRKEEGRGGEDNSYGGHYVHSVIIPPFCHGVSDLTMSGEISPFSPPVSSRMRERAR